VKKEAIVVVVIQTKNLASVVILNPNSYDPSLMSPIFDNVYMFLEIRTQSLSPV
jgi:hypothetical protein